MVLIAVVDPRGTHGETNELRSLPVQRLRPPHLGAGDDLTGGVDEVQLAASDGRGRREEGGQRAVGQPVPATDDAPPPGRIERDGDGHDRLALGRGGDGVRHGIDAADRRSEVAVAAGDLGPDQARLLGRAGEHHAPNVEQERGVEPERGGGAVEVGGTDVGATQLQTGVVELAAPHLVQVRIDVRGGEADPFGEPGVEFTYRVPTLGSSLRTEADDEGEGRDTDDKGDDHLSSSAGRETLHDRSFDKGALRLCATIQQLFRPVHHAVAGSS